jgi:hypothetical protein
VTAAVDVGGEGDPRLLDLREVAQAEDLEAAAVGEDRAVPAHHLVEAAERSDDLGARTQI